MSYKPSYSSSSSSSFISYGRTEISMRDEFLNTLRGTGQEISKAQRGLIRVMRRDDDGNVIPCACVNQITKEPDKDTPCPLCLGEGNYWDEQYVSFYQWEPGAETSQAFKEKLVIPGNINVPIRVFYLDWSQDLHLEDKMIELNLDKEGEVIIPPTRKSIYRIGHLFPQRLDEGRVEFWMIVVYEERLIRNALNMRF